MEPEEVSSSKTISKTLSKTIPIEMEQNGKGKEAIEMEQNGKGKEAIEMEQNGKGKEAIDKFKNTNLTVFPTTVFPTYEDMAKIRKLSEQLRNGLRNR